MYVTAYKQIQCILSPPFFSLALLLLAPQDFRGAPPPSPRAAPAPALAPDDADADAGARAQGLGQQREQGLGETVRARAQQRAE